MPTVGHTEPPDEHGPCHCGGCLEFQAIHAGHCAELPRETREAQRRLDRDALRRHQAAATGLWGAA